MTTIQKRTSVTLSDHVSHPYNTTGKIIDPYILIFNRNLEDTRFCVEW